MYYVSGTIVHTVSQWCQHTCSVGHRQMLLHGKTGMRWICLPVHLKNCVIHEYHSCVAIALFIKLKHSSRSEHPKLRHYLATSRVACSGNNVNSREHRPKCYMMKWVPSTLCI